MTAWVVIVAVGLGTYALRAAMFVVIGGRSLPAWTTTPLALVAPAAITALTVQMTLTRGGDVAPAPVAELLAVGAGFAATRRTGNVMLAVAIGMPVYWLASAVFG